MSEKEREWLNRAMVYGGGFLQTFADACFRADDENVFLLMPVLEALMLKYPQYSHATLRTAMEDLASHENYCHEHGGHLRNSPACDLAIERARR